MKRNTFLLPLMMLLALAMVNLVAFANTDTPGVPQVKKESGITYIDIGIYQPNVEDCFGTSVIEAELDSDWLKIYPNPNQGEFTVEFALGQPLVTINIEMYDATGRLVMKSTEPVDGSHFKKDIAISNLKKGVYFVRVTGKGMSGVKSIVIN